MKDLEGTFSVIVKPMDRFTALFLADAGPGVEVISHASLPEQLAQVVNVRGGVTYQRAVRQFGTEVPDTVKKAGIGPNLK